MLPAEPKPERIPISLLALTLTLALLCEARADDDPDYLSLVEGPHAFAGERDHDDSHIDMLVVGTGADGDAHGYSLGAGSDPYGFSFDSMSDAELAVHMAKMEQSFLRPGLIQDEGMLVPFQAAQTLARGFRMRAETGVGYDSNTLLSNGGYRSPTHPDRGRVGGAVSWLRFNVGYSSGADRDGRKIFYGFDIGGDVFSYDRGRTRSGRGTVEPTFAPYVGIRGAKTTVRLGSRYRFGDGNFLYSYDARREAPVAESHTYGYNLSVTRDLPRGRLGYIYDFRRIDFDSDTLLNDQDSRIHDLSYLHDLPSMPKTSLGLGFRFGTTDTVANPDTKLFEPSLRVNYAATAKTALNGRVGYSFRDYTGPQSIGSDGRMSYALGANWLASQRVRVGIQAYRDFSPSFVSAGQSYDTDGVSLQLNYASPFWLLHFQSHMGFERADYYSTVLGGASNRKDDYFRWGVSAGRPVRLVRWLDTSISVFYDYSENQSNDFQGAFDRHFTGLRLTGTL